MWLFHYSLLERRHTRLHLLAGEPLRAVVFIWPILPICSNKCGKRIAAAQFSIISVLHNCQHCHANAKHILQSVEINDMSHWQVPDIESAHTVWTTELMWHGIFIYWHMLLVIYAVQPNSALWQNTDKHVFSIGTLTEWEIEKKNNITPMFNRPVMKRNLKYRNQKASGLLWAFILP